MGVHTAFIPLTHIHIPPLPCLICLLSPDSRVDLHLVRGLGVDRLSELYVSYSPPGGTLTSECQVPPVAQPLPDSLGLAASSLPGWWVEEIPPRPHPGWAIPSPWGPRALGHLPAQHKPPRLVPERLAGISARVTEPDT